MSERGRNLYTLAVGPYRCYEPLQRGAADPSLRSAQSLWSLREWGYWATGEELKRVTYEMA